MKSTRTFWINPTYLLTLLITYSTEDTKVSRLQDPRISTVTGTFNGSTQGQVLPEGSSTIHLGIVDSEPIGGTVYRVVKRLKTGVKTCLSGLKKEMSWSDVKRIRQSTPGCLIYTRERDRTLQDVSKVLSENISEGLRNLPSNPRRVVVVCGTEGPLWGRTWIGSCQDLACFVNTIHPPSSTLWCVRDSTRTLGDRGNHPRLPLAHPDPRHYYNYFRLLPTDYLGDPPSPLLGH